MTLIERAITGYPNYFDNPGCGKYGRNSENTFLIEGGYDELALLRENSVDFSALENEYGAASDFTSENV